MEIQEDVLVVGDKRVVSDLFYPQVLGKNGVPRKRAILIPGGGKSGHVSGMRLCSLFDSGIPAKRFDAGVGTSASSYNLVGYCANQTHYISREYQALSWFNPKVFSGAFSGDPLGLLHLERNLREMLDVETFKQCRLRLSIGVADLKANPILHVAQEADDIFDLMYASSALFPIVPGRAIRGVYCVDGGFALRSVIATWMRQWLIAMTEGQEVDLLFISNRPHPHHRNWLDRLEERLYQRIIDCYLQGYPELLRGARSLSLKIRTIARVFERQYPNMRMCALYPLSDENIYPIEWNKHILQKRGALTYQRMRAFLKALKPAREI